MRSFTAILTIVIVALMVREAKSQHYIDRNGTYLTSVPDPYYAANGGMMRGATWAHIVADGGREATAQETADWQAAQDAAALAAAEAAAQAEAQRVAGLAGEYAGAVAVLQANLSTVGWSIPCDAEAVTADLIGRAHAKTLTEAQRKAKDDIFQAYFILQSKGVTNSDIAAIWALIGGEE